MKYDKMFFRIWVVISVLWWAWWASVVIIYVIINGLDNYALQEIFGYILLMPIPFVVLVIGLMVRWIIQAVP